MTRTAEPTEERCPIERGDSSPKRGCCSVPRDAKNLDVYAGTDIASARRTADASTPPHSTDNCTAAYYIAMRRPLNTFQLKFYDWVSLQ